MNRFLIVVELEFSLEMGGKCCSSVDKDKERPEVGRDPEPENRHEPTMPPHAPPRLPTPKQDPAPAPAPPEPEPKVNKALLLCDLHPVKCVAVGVLHLLPLSVVW